VTLTSSDGKAIDLNFGVLGETLTMTPTNRLAFDAGYIVKISTGLTGAAGGSGMRESYASLFSTVPLPKIVSTDPKDGERTASPYTGFTIQFNTVMNYDTVMPHLTFNPPLSPTQVYTYGGGNMFGINFGAQPSTDYAVQIAPGIEDPYGNKTSESLTIHFRTADLPPDVHLHVPDNMATYNAYDPARVYAIHTNINSIDFKLYRVPPTDLMAYSQYDPNYQPPASAQLLRSWTQPIEAALNQIDATPIDLVEGGGQLEPGLYLLWYDSPQLPKDQNAYRIHYHFMIVSSIHLTLKQAPDETLVWATDYKSGEPVANLPLTFYSNNPTGQVVATGTTDAQGVARVKPSGQPYNVSNVVSQSPFAAIASQWSNGISQYDFGLPPAPAPYYPGETTHYNTYLYTDRPIYRPGQTVDFKGIVRIDNDVKYRLPDISKVHVTLQSPNGETLLDKDLDVSTLGTFFGDVKLGDGAALGQYNVSVQANGVSIGSGNFTVAAYRAPEFQVNVTPKDKEIVRGQSTSAQVEVSYFFGGGVANQPVQWNVLAESYNFTPPWGGNYRYSDVDDPYVCFDCWWYYRYAPPPQPILSGSGVTDQNGNVTIELPGDLQMNGQPITQSVSLIVEATVTGKDNQVISGRGTIVRHGGDFYVGLQTREYVGEENKPSNVDLIAVDWQGNRLANKSIDVSIVRREWVNTFVEDKAGGGAWQTETKDAPIDTQTATTNDKGEASITFTPPKAGSYKITAKAVDSGGREIRASVFEWVTGIEFVSWRRENNDRITLIGDKSSYAPGETAKILIPSPFQGEHYALITIERGGILRHELLKITSNSQIYELPITADLAPNIYFSVVLVKGQDPTNKLSDYKVGLLPIEVKPIAQTLQIKLTPDRSTALPGDDVTYSVEVTDSNGQPVQVEFSLDLVDKAVLSLLPRPAEGAILEAFYGKRGLSVQTSADLAVSVNKYNEQLQQDLELQKHAANQVPATGGGPDMYEAIPAPAAQPTQPAAEAPKAADGAARQSSASALPPNVEVRQEFADTAYWNPQITTDAGGKASVKIKLPDNLTTWTFRSVGATADTIVGESTVDVIATKPVLIRPVTPRFFTVGDKAQLAANVSNNTDNPLTATVTLSSTGVTLESDAQQTISIAAHSEGKATWQVTVQDVPSVQLVFIAQSGDFVDASKPRLATGPDGSLLVYRYTAPDIVGTAGELKQAGSRTEIVALPPNTDVTQGEVSVEVDPSLAASMIDGLDYLEHYPYECTEQTVSRFLPNVLTYRALKELGISDPALEAKLSDLAKTALDKLYLRQHSDGGWGWWIDDKSSPYLTAYVLYGLIQARMADFDVRGDVIDRGEQYLVANLSQNTRDLSNWDANQQAWFLYVLAEDGKAQSDKINPLFDERAKLSLYAKAYLALAIGDANPADARIKTLMSDLNNAAILSATGAHWEEGSYDWWSMTTDTRSTAIILDAYARLDPNNALAPNAVRWLMVARKFGYWETTQETAWALIGLTDWMKTTGELKADYDYALFLNDKSIEEGHFAPKDVKTPVKLQIAIKDLIADQANRLTFSRGPGDGVMYYTAHLRVFQPVEDLKPVDRGVIVSRRYTLASCTESDRSKCPEVKEVKLGDVIRVDLTIIAPHDLYYLIVEDPLPAGAEAIDTGLATTSLLASGANLQRQSSGAEGGYSPYWYWWNWYSRSELRDEKVVLFTDYLYRGTYEYSYTMRATLPGDYKVIPTVASEFYFPEVFGRSDGRLLSIGQ
jgi:uncharacterized protein YfaS (alpha-2-macroglobulin family)